MKHTARGTVNDKVSKHSSTSENLNMKALSRDKVSKHASTSENT